jgi:hypothetical protein
MNYSISINEQEIHRSLISEFQLLSDINSLIPTAVLTIKDLSLMSNSLTKRGTPVIIKLLYDDNRIQIIKYRIVSYRKEPVSSPEKIDRIILQLVHESLYNQSPLSSAYYGTASSVIAEALEKDVQYKNIKIANSTDRPFPRYRCKETTAAFVRKIAKYATAEDSPMFAYMGFDEVPRLHSKLAIINSSPVAAIVPMLAQITPEPRVSYPLVAAHALAYFSEGKEVYGSLQINFTSVYNTQFADREGLQAGVIIPTSERDMDELVEKPMPIRAEFVSYFAPQADELSLAINRVESTNQDIFYATAIVSADAKIELADSVILMPGEGAAMEQGTYYVKHLAILQTEQQLYRKLQLVRMI